MREFGVWSLEFGVWGLELITRRELQNPSIDFPICSQTCHPDEGGIWNALLLTISLNDD
jgi:hypothetical protein